MKAVWKGTTMASKDDVAMIAKMPDAEPTFCLRGQDVFAALLVDQWADLASSAGVHPHKILEARQRANQMRNWKMKKIPD